MSYYYQLTHIEPKKKTILKISDYLVNYFKKKYNINVNISHKKILNTYLEISKLPYLGYDRTLINNKVIEVLIAVILNDIDYIIKPTFKISIIKTGLKPKNKL